MIIFMARIICALFLMLTNKGSENRGWSRQEEQRRRDPVFSDSEENRRGCEEMIPFRGKGVQSSSLTCLIRYTNQASQEINR